MHDGLRAYPAAVEALRQLRRAGKRTVVLSNAPRRAAVIAARNAEIGIPPELPDHLLSSGEDAWQHLKTRPDAWYRALGQRCYHLGPARDLGMREASTSPSSTDSPGRTSSSTPALCTISTRWRTSGPDRQSTRLHP